MSDQIHFLRQSIKGKIADMVFERMMRDDQNHSFTIIPYGYEYTLPELAQYREFIKETPELARIHRSPDFLLIKKDRTCVYFVEVKYRKHFDFENVLKWCNLICETWPSAYLFLVTQECFYFDSCAEVIKNKGKMRGLDTEVISLEMQNKYLNVLKEYITLEKKY